MFSRAHLMHFEILNPRTNVEPLPLIENNAADLAARADPIGDNRNERNFSIWWNPPENLGIPNRNVGKVIVASDAVAVRDIEHATVAKSNRSRQTGIAQRQGDIVSAAEMLVDQRLQIGVSEDVAAVSDEGFHPEIGLNVLDAAARLEQNGLVHQLDGMTLVVVLREKALERIRQLVRINNERLHADVDQVIEGEADERLLENRNEWLGQIIGGGSQTRDKTRTEDECLCD